MVFEDGHPLAGKPIGLRQVLSERYGEEYVKGKKQDELVNILAAEDDFKGSFNKSQSLTVVHTQIMFCYVSFSLLEQ